MPRRVIAAMGIWLLLLSNRVAFANESTDETENSQNAGAFRPGLDLDYLWDGGAAAFIYGSLAVSLGTNRWLDPPETPRVFAATDGPELPFGDTVPSSALTVYNVAGALLVAASDSPSRWYHLKGYGEAALTTAALTSVAKNYFGRRRPHFPAGEDPDRRRSFFSGHASMSAVTTVYVGLYLETHVFPRYSGPVASVWKTAAWAGLGTVLIGVPYSRVYDNRHYVSDVLTGAAVGSAAAVGFFLYQQHRFEDAEDRFHRNSARSVRIVPDFESRGVALQGRW